MPTPSSIADAARTPALATHIRALVSALFAILFAAAVLQAQDPANPVVAEESPTEPAPEPLADGAPPSGSARITVDGRPAGQIPFTIRQDGPRFGLAPLAELLGVELRTGPLGDMHVLVYDDKEIRLGPEHTSYVVATSDGAEEVHHFLRAPVKGIYGLLVPLEALRRAFGDELGYDVSWDFLRLELAISRGELREIEASLDLIHQYRVSTVEMVFQQKPRYRFVRFDGAVELQFVGDRILLDDVFSRPADPLVTGMVFEPTRLRIELVENAAAAEPRLVAGGGVFRLVVDVYRQRAGTSTSVDTPELPRLPEDLGGIRTIVLDPGHGGEETGAIGKNGTIEAVLNLRVARLLKSRLEQRLPVRVLMTRDSNVDIPHDTRVAIANQNKADLFISLHFNSYHGSQARGAETFFLSREASDQIAEKALRAEHAFLTDDEREELADLELILWDLAQSFHLAESQRFANLVQEELNETLGLRNRGVRQAPFRVLMGASMPAVLVELGFLSNPSEERKLQSTAYLAQLADALVRAITRFKTQMDARPPGTEEVAPGAGR
ncbi:MAG: N-acetylmuramoyl-L-alanine amidase [Thermoanaerobaculia bacterium]|nr:N-acetylmuramoyl-L-alanine amidase [Thermoanaerobaculia bacterium]